MRCPHCGVGETVVQPITTTSARRGTVTHDEAEVCPDCSWWVAPPRVADDPNLMARTSGYGYTTQVP